MTLTGFENLSGSIFDDVLTGDNDANLLAGDSGDDMLSGGDGDDTLYGDGRVIVDTHGTGGSGPIVTYADVADLPFGEPSGNDVLDGGKGDDTLCGGGGDDLLTGGKGNDTFVFGAGRRRRPHHRLPEPGHDLLRGHFRASTISATSTLTTVGSDVLITWGTADSILLEGSAGPNQHPRRRFHVRLRRAVPGVAPRTRSDRGAPRRSRAARRGRPAGRARPTSRHNGAVANARRRSAAVDGAGAELPGHATALRRDRFRPRERHPARGLPSALQISARCR